MLVHVEVREGSLGSVLTPDQPLWRVGIMTVLAQAAALWQPHRRESFPQKEQDGQ